MTGFPRPTTVEECAAFEAWAIKPRPSAAPTTVEQAFIAGYRAAQEASARPTLTRSEQAAVLAAKFRASGTEHAALIAELADLLAWAIDQLEND